MEALAELLSGLLAGLPAARPFLGLFGAAVLAAAGVVFALRRTRVVAALRAGFAGFLGALSAAFLLGMVFLSGLQILLRNLFDTGVLWVDPLLRHLVLFLALTGAVAATGAKRHVQINVLGRLLSGVPARLSGALVALLGATISLALAHASLVLLSEEIEFGDVAFLGLPTWAIIAVFPAAFLALAFRLSLLAFEEAAGTAPRADAEIPLPEREAGEGPP